MANNDWYKYYANPNLAISEYMHSIGLDECDIEEVFNMINTRLAMSYYPLLDSSRPLGTLESRDLELALLFYTHLCFADIPSLGGWQLVTWTQQGALDTNRHPKFVRLIALNGSAIPGTYSYSDIIPVRDNPMDMPRIITIWSYLNKIKQLNDDVMKISSVACLPAVITGDKKQATALRETAKKLGIKDPFIIGDAALASSVQTFDIRLAISPIDIYNLKTKYKNECLASMGIYNAEQKRERLVTQELINQNDFSDTTYNLGVLCRKRFVADLKRIAGIDIGFKELYDYNFESNTDLEAEKAKAIAKAEAKGTKEGDPNANVNKGGFPNGNKQ